MEEANEEGNDNINGSPVEETQEHGNDGINGDMDEAQEQEQGSDGMNDSDMDEAQEQGNDGIRRPKTLKNEEREVIYRILLQNYVYRKVRRSVKKMLVFAYSTSTKTIDHIWKQCMSVGDVRYRKTQNCDRKRVQIDVAQFQSIPLSKRSTFRCMATALNTSKYVCQRLHKKGLFRCYSNAIKPKLTPENKIARLLFYIKMLEDVSIPEDPTFNGMYDIVYIDEK
ncbi:hypothetical protein CCACVL1_30340 [Corchorus capsularis]|uniref:Uncharacterized protein n=1 Tax=Corchorus capsularis TaxID=210143 RepID=A0A1R3FXQ7_COCAP|nr:hypothetical protein CCACVL1_30340 [Corchorus capsularis]